MTPGFVDIHCHVIPSLDDGPETMDEAVRMCRMAFDDGTEILVATPHVNPGVYDNDRESIKTGFESLKSAVESADIPIGLSYGADVRLSEALMRKTDLEEFITLNQTNKYMLLEFADSLIPPNTDKFLFDLKLKGLTPIITHPERNFEIQRHPNMVFQFANMGVLIQITALSITGGFGEFVQDLSELLLTHNLVHIVASDAHSADHRTPRLGESFHETVRIVGEKKAKELFSTNPRAVFDGSDITPEDHHEILSGQHNVVMRGLRKMKRWYKDIASKKGGS